MIPSDLMSDDQSKQPARLSRSVRRKNPAAHAAHIGDHSLIHGHRRADRRSPKSTVREGIGNQLSTTLYLFWWFPRF